MKFRNYFPWDQQLQQNKHLPPMVPKFEDLVAKTPLETNGAEVNKSILCSLFVLFVCTALWSELSLLMRVQKPVLPLYISQVMQTMGVDWCFSALGKKPVNKRCITKYNGISICLFRTPLWALHPQSQTQIFEEMLQRSLRSSNGALNETSSNWCISISSVCTTRDHFYLKSQENLLLKVWRDKNYCTCSCRLALQILRRCESQAAKHV